MKTKAPTFQEDLSEQSPITRYRLSAPILPEMPEQRPPAPETTELDTRTLLAANWFLDRHEAELPKPPFSLTPAVTVMGDAFYKNLRVECEAVRAFAEGRRDKKHPRHKSGALLAEIRALRELVDRG